MDLNLYISNSTLSLPIRLCLNKTGPLESSFMSSVINASIGESNMVNNNANMKSNTFFIPIYFFILLSFFHLSFQHHIDCYSSTKQTIKHWYGGNGGVIDKPSCKESTDTKHDGSPYILIESFKF